MALKFAVQAPLNLNATSKFNEQNLDAPSLLKFWRIYPHGFIGVKNICLRGLRDILWRDGIYDLFKGLKIGDLLIPKRVFYERVVPKLGAFASDASRDDLRFFEILKLPRYVRPAACDFCKNFPDCR